MNSKAKFFDAKEIELSRSKYLGTEMQSEMLKEIMQVLQQKISKLRSDKFNSLYIFGGENCIKTAKNRGY